MRGSPPNDGLLLGTRYALIRREIRETKAKIQARASKGEYQPFRVLISIGGADHLNLAPELLSSLDRWSEAALSIRIVVASDSQEEQLRVAIEACPHNVEVKIAPLNMAEHFAWADAAVTAAGGTVWECLFFDLRLAIICVAENQRANVEAVKDCSNVLYLGSVGDNRELDLKGILAKLSESLTQWVECRNDFKSSETLVDGYGANRAIMRLMEHKLWLRKASIDDAETIFVWANDPIVRSASFTSAKIAWEDHCRWYREKLNSSSSVIYIAADYDDASVGQIRFEIGSIAEMGDGASVGISLDKDHRGKGLAREVVALGTAKFRQEFGYDGPIYALTKASNQLSASVFSAAGYRLSEMSSKDSDGVICLTNVIE